MSPDYAEIPKNWDAYPPNPKNERLVPENFSLEVSGTPGTWLWAVYSGKKSIGKL